MPESLKNILLVMANGGYLVPRSEDPSRVQLWEETWKRLDKFLPWMFAELFPEPNKEEAAGGTKTVEKEPVEQSK